MFRWLLALSLVVSCLAPARSLELGPDGSLARLVVPAPAADAVRLPEAPARSIGIFEAVAVEPWSLSRFEAAHRDQPLHADTPTPAPIRATRPARAPPARS